MKKINKADKAACLEHGDISFLHKRGLDVDFNFFSNLKYYPNMSPITDLRGKFRNFPAVIVGAGPSLDDNKFLIKNLKNKAVIIAVDVVLAALISVDVIPDIVVSTDPHKDVESAMGASTDGAVLAVGHDVHPALLERFKSNKVFLVPGCDGVLPWEWAKQFLRIQSHDKTYGNIVSHTAFHIADILGCSPIILCGQDLSYPGNSTHAGDCKVRKTLPAGIKDQMLKVDSCFGYRDSVSTSPFFFNAITHFEEIIKKSGRTTINATEGGARIPGASPAKLRHVISLIDEANRFRADLVGLDVKQIIASAGGPLVPRIESLVSGLFTLQEIMLDVISRGFMEESGGASDNKLIISAILSRAMMPAYTYQVSVMQDETLSIEQKKNKIVSFANSRLITVMTCLLPVLQKTISFLDGTIQQKIKMEEENGN